jgi:dipeptidyl aminopeptidase/acylaminoacyl peptidase
MKIKITLFIGFIVLAISSLQAKEIPLESFFKHSLYESVKISPDGKNFAVTIKKDDTVALAVINRKKNKITANYSFGEFKPIVRFEWANNERILMVVRKVVGNLDNKGGPAYLYSAEANGRRVKELFKPDTSLFSLISTLKDDPKHILIAKYHSEDQGAVAIRKMDIYTGRFRGVVDRLDKDVRSSGINQRGKVKAITRYEVDSEDRSVGTTTFFYRKETSDPWSEITLEGLSKEESVNILGLSPSEDIIYFSSDFETSTLAIYQFDMNSGKYTKLFEDIDVDVESLIYAYDESIIGVRYVPDYPEFELFDDKHAESKIYQDLDGAFPNSQAYITSYTEGGNQAVVWITNDRVEGDYYLLNMKSMQLSYLMSARPWLKEKQMAQIDSFKIKARDGLDIYGYLTLPKTISKNVSTIIKVHGGPWGTRDSYEFDAETQFLASRGWAVLEVNFRGSGGYGKAFQKAGTGEWGKAMQDDLLDALNHFVNKGILNKDKVCIYGASYGAYSAMMGAARDPDVFKCAIGYLGVYDIDTLMSSGDIAKSKESLTYVQKLIGISEEQYASISPAHMVDKIKIPLLLVHGEDDVRATIKHFDLMTEALEDAGKPFESMVRDEGHGFSKQKNILDFYQKLERFLKHHLNAEVNVIEL